MLTIRKNTTADREPCDHLVKIWYYTTFYQLAMQL